MKKFLVAILFLTGGLTATSAATLVVAAAYHAGSPFAQVPWLLSPAVRAGELDGTATEPGPVTEICLPAAPSEATVCAAFFLDETGYTLCVSDDLVGDSYCRTSPYSTVPDFPDLQNGGPGGSEIPPDDGVTQAVEA